MKPQISTQEWWDSLDATDKGKTLAKVNEHEHCYLTYQFHKLPSSIKNSITRFHRGDFS